MSTYAVQETDNYFIREAKNLLRLVEENNQQFSLKSVLKVYEIAAEFANHATPLIKSDFFRTEFARFVNEPEDHHKVFPLSAKYLIKNFLKFSILFASKLSSEDKEVRDCISYLFKEIKGIKYIRQKIFFLSFFFNLKVVPEEFKRKCVKTFFHLMKNGSEKIRETIENIIQSKVKLILSEEDMSLMDEEEIRYLIRLSVTSCLRVKKYVDFVEVSEPGILLPEKKIVEIINKCNNKDAKIYLYVLKEDNLLSCLYKFFSSVVVKVDEKRQKEGREDRYYNVSDIEELVSTLFEKIESLNLHEKDKTEIISFVCSWIYRGLFRSLSNYNIARKLSVRDLFDWYEESRIKFYEEIFKKALVLR